MWQNLIVDALPKTVKTASVANALLLNDEWWECPKETVQSFIDLVNMAKMADGWKNKQPSATQELGRLFPSIEVEGGGGWNQCELLRVDARESSASVFSN